MKHWRESGTAFFFFLHTDPQEDGVLVREQGYREQKETASFWIYQVATMTWYK